MSLIDELKRRNVFKVGAAYLALAWVIVQITSAIVPALNLPGTLVPTVVWIGVIGFPCVLIFSWIYELTPEGLKLESEVDRSQSITHVTSKRLDYIIIAMLGVAILLFIADRFVPRSAPPAQESAAGAGHARDSSANTAEDSRGHGPLPQQESTPAPAPDDKSIAVLPFTDMSAEKNQEYMSDGIAEELLNLLAKIPELQVASRSSAFTFRNKDIEIPEIAKRLNVAHILEGSVRKSGNRIRITAQLVDARTDKHLWSETYDRTLDDIFAVQDEIAGSVVEQLKIKLLGAAPTVKAVNPEAYALFLQARQLRRQQTREGYEQALDLSRQALEIDPGYAAAWVEQCFTYVSQALNGLRSNDEAYALAREAVNKALAIDPDHARAHDLLGWIAKSYDGDLAAAVQHYQRALALEPGNLAILGNASSLLGALGRLDAAIALNEWTVVRDPLNTVGVANLGGGYVAAGRLDDAIASYRTALRLSPGYIGAQAGIGQALLLKGDRKTALTEAQKEGDDINRLFTVAMIEHSLDQRSESDAALAELIRKHEREAPYLIAEAYAWRNEADLAFAWLEKAVIFHDAGLEFLPTDPWIGKLKKDPRWPALLHRLGKTPEQLAAISFDVKLPQ